MDYHINHYSRCLCGAITIALYDNMGENLIGEYSCKEENFNKFFPHADLSDINRVPEGTTFACDHCVNHFGLDLCGCGSGEEFGHCDNDLPECKTPSQQTPYTAFTPKSQTKDTWTMTTLSELIDYETEMNARLNAIKNNIYATIRDDIASTPIDGVTEVSESPRVITVNVSQTHNIWSPEYYMSDKQADLISEALTNAHSPSQLLTKIRDIIEKKRVTIGKTQYPINDTTISILKKYL